MDQANKETRKHVRRSGLGVAEVVFVFLLALWATFPGMLAAQTHMIPASFSDVAAKASPAVVNISTEKVIKGGGQAFEFKGPWGDKDPFNEFFDRFFGGKSPMERKENSLGSGFIIDPDGLIITNNHVVENAQDIVVKISDGQEFHAEILGRDPKTDLALIKIKPKTKLPALTLGDSNKLKIGDWVVAIGNPFGLEHTVTVGILSARGRAIGAGPYDDFLQTDASINPGNSGGPLLNLEGEVVGINTAIVAGGTGIGFAIPTSMAKGIVDQLREKGKVVRGWLGVMIQKITPELAKSFNLKDEKGALIGDVTPDSPAEKAGIKRGDVIVRFNGKEIDDFSQLPPIVADTPVGSEVVVRVLRNGETKDFEIKLGELKEERVATTTEEPDMSENMGFSVKELTPELASRLGLSEDQGVVITGTADGGPADESGMKPGDLILEINRQPVPSMGVFRKVTKSLKKGDTVLFLVKRGPNTLFFTLEIE